MKIEAIGSQVFQTVNGRRRPLPMNLEIEVSAGETYETVQGSIATIKGVDFDGKSYEITMRSATIVEIVKDEISDSQSTTSYLSVDLLSGTITHKQDASVFISKPVRAQGRVYRSRSRSFRAAPKGTTFDLTVVGANQVRLKVFDGKAYISDDSTEKVYERLATMPQPPTWDLTVGQPLP